MPRVTCHMSISLDGYVAGPGQSQDDPIGRGGMALHQWHVGPAEERDPVDARLAESILAGKGAYVMGRNMYAAPSVAAGVKTTGGAGGGRSRRTTHQSSC